MSAETYKIIHVVGLILLFMALGSTLLESRAPGQKPPRAAMILHGIGLLLMLVAGFGLLARTGITSFPWPIWVFVKFGVWVLLAALPIVVRKGLLPTAAGWIAAAALGGTAAWIGLATVKPFIG